MDDSRLVNGGTLVVVAACNLVAIIIILDNSYGWVRVEIVAVVVVDKRALPSAFPLECSSRIPRSVHYFEEME
jgi:hypothetical protein